MFQALIQTLIFIFASAFIVQFITKNDRKRLVYLVAFALLVITNYYLVINLINLYELIKGQLA